MSELEFQHYPIDVASIPKAWAVTSISDLGADVQSGFPTGEHNRSGLGIPHIRPMNIDRNGVIDLSEVKYVSPDQSDLRLQPGDVLFNNTNSPELIGKTAAITRSDNWAFSNHMTRLRFGEGIDFRYAAHQLHFLWMTRYFRHRCVNHVNQASISGKPLAQTVPFLLAPENEQRRIVAKIEELFSDLDAGVAALERAKANLKSYRAAVLKAAVEGKLTAEWRAKHPKTEPASKLLEHILVERRKRWEADQLTKFAAAGKEPPKNWKTKYVEPTPPDTATLSTLPAGWCWATVEQCSSEATVGHVGPMKDRYLSNGIPFLRSQNVRPLKFDGEGLRYIPRSFHDELRKSKLFGGELLVVRSGNIGEACVYPVDQQEANCADLVICRFLGGLLAQYAAIFVVSPLGQRFVVGKRTGSALSHFNVGAMEAAPIPLPPFAEQQQIVNEVEERLSQIVVAGSQIENGLLRAARLRQSILMRAFEGKLVPQDPNDESASVLMARMKQDTQSRSAAMPTSNGRPVRKKSAVKAK